jgi:hypothetical protein
MQRWYFTLPGGEFSVVSARTEGDAVFEQNLRDRKWLRCYSEEMWEMHLLDRAKSPALSPDPEANAPSVSPELRALLSQAKAMAREEGACMFAWAVPIDRLQMEAPPDAQSVVISWGPTQMIRRGCGQIVGFLAKAEASFHANGHKEIGVEGGPVHVKAHYPAIPSEDE